MTYYVPTVLTVDTVVLNWPCNMRNFDFTGWRYKKRKKEGKSDQFTKTIGNVVLIYLPQWCTLMVSFSASKVANGCNAFPYKNSQYELLKYRIEKTIFDETKKTLHIEDSFVTRFDVFRNIIFPTISDCKYFIKWAQWHPVVGGYLKTTYNDNGDYRRYKSGLTCKFYLKNEDPALPDEIKKTLLPSVRFEAGCRNSMRRKLLGTQIRGDILKYPAIWQSFFNKTLEKFTLAGTILNFDEYENIVTDILQFENPTNRQSTIKKKVDMLLDTSRGNIVSDRKKQVGLINKIANYNILPFAFEKAELIPDGTLMAPCVISVEEQQLIEYNNYVTERNIKLFESVLKKKKEAKLCKKILSKPVYIIIVKLLNSFTQKFFTRVPVMDSS